MIDMMGIMLASEIALRSFNMRSLHGIVLAQNRSGLGHRCEENHNCDQNGQQLSSTSSNGLAYGDHVRARTEFI
jgi:hypothetical protein